VIAFEVDEPKSLLAIRYHGHVAAEETEKGLNDVRSGLVKLKSGFRLLVDLTELDRMDVGCAPFVEKAMDLCNEKGASMVVRVIPDPHRDIGLQIMSIFHYSGNVRIITCHSVAEANEILFSETQT
jgi:anti-anti-sigma regulatory factor